MFLVKYRNQSAPWEVIMEKPIFVSSIDSSGIGNHGNHLKARRKYTSFWTYVNTFFARHNPRPAAVKPNPVFIVVIVSFSSSES